MQAAGVMYRFRAFPLQGETLVMDVIAASGALRPQPQGLRV